MPNWRMRFLPALPALEHFPFSPKHGNALSLCFHAIPDAKPLRTFAGIAIADAGWIADHGCAGRHIPG
ncbi:hypothetical protein ACC760_37720, partial [Rhizobium ruizarguesonis]